MSSTMGQCRSANAEVGPLIPDLSVPAPLLHPEGLCPPIDFCPFTLALLCTPDPACEV